MGSQFTKFEKLHGPAKDVQPVPDEVVQRYRGRLPDELLAEWQATGWCSYADGFLWLVDPAVYDDLLPDWLNDAASATVFLRTALGGLVYWDGTEAIFLDVTRADTTPVFDEMDFVFNGVLCRKQFLDAVMDLDYYKSEKKRLGRVAVDECYGFFPPRSMGANGPEDLKKVKLREHLAILAQVKG